MISPDAGQVLLASKATVRQVVLVRLRTYSNVLTGTLLSTYYWSNVPVLYQWTGGTAVQFSPVVRQVSAVVRGFPHIPDGATLPTRDGLQIELDVSTEGAAGLWYWLQLETLHGAKVDVATLLVDEATFAGPLWADLSAMGSVHTVRWRGAVSTVSPYEYEKGTLSLACDTIEPVLTWPTARDVLKNDPRDMGKRYPIPVGYARQVELVGVEVGHATTLAAEVAATGTTAWSITDGEGFPTSGTFTAKCGDELVTVNGATSTRTSLVITARGVLGSTAAKHSRGATVVEYVRDARYVLSARECRGISALFWQIPSGQRVRLEPNTFGWNPAAIELEAGLTLGVVSFAREQLAAALDVAAAVIQQPEFAQSGANTIKLAWGSYSETVDGTASVGPAVHSIVTSYFSPEAGFRIEHTTATSDEVGVFWAAIAEQLTAKVVRVRPVFDIFVQSSGSFATAVYYEVDSVTVDGSILFENKNLLISQAPTATTRQQIAGDWMTPDAPDPGLEGFTVSDLLGSSVSAGFRCAVYLDQTAGGDGPNTACFVNAAASYWEVEIEPPPVTSTLPVDVAAAWAVGNGLTLVADVYGVTTRSNEVAVTSLDFSTTTGWSGTNCTISVQTIGSRQGIRLASPSAVNAILVHSGLTLNWSAAGGSLTFEVYVTAAFKDKLSSASGRFVEIKVGTNSTDRFSYPFSPADLIDDGWTTLCADLAYHANRVTLGAGATLSNITRVELAAEWDSTSGAPQVHFRNVRFMQRTLVDHPIDVGTFVVEQLAGITGGVDASAATTAKSNLPSVVLAGDLRNAGEAFADLLGRIGFESRTNWMALEAAAGTVFRPLNAGTAYNFATASRTLSLFRGLRTELKQLDEIATEFSALWDYRPDSNALGVEAYRKVSRADTVQNDISADVATATITEGQQLVGIRAALPQTFLLLGDSVSLIEVWAYYVKEALRFAGTNARRWSMVVDFAEAWDLEPGDIVGFVTPWDDATVKARITRVAYPPDAPGIGLSLEQVI